MKLSLAKRTSFMYNTSGVAGVMELVDVADSKSAASDGVGVRVPPPAPRRSKVRFAPTIFYQNRHPLRSLAPPLQIEPAALGFDLVFRLNLKEVRF